MTTSKDKGNGGKEPICRRNGIRCLVLGRMHKEGEIPVLQQRRGGCTADLSLKAMVGFQDRVISEKTGQGNKKA